MAIDVGFDAARNVATLGGQEMVFHCHHYNCALQRAITDSLGQTAAADLLRAAGAESLRPQLVNLTQKMDEKQTLALSRSLFSNLGFGVLDMTRLNAIDGEVVVRQSHYGLGWLSKYGESKDPVCHFNAGFIAASIGVARSLAPERIVITEHACSAQGHEHCSFKVEVR